MKKMLSVALVVALVMAMVLSLGFAQGVVDDPVPVYVDIKPGSWPNPINIKSKGVLAVAICGTEDFDVRTIDPATVRIFIERDADGDGVPALRWSYADVATPYTGDYDGGHALRGDGYLDLVFQFDTQTLVADELASHVGETVPLFITGNLLRAYTGDPIMGQDYVRVLALPNGI